MQNIAPVRALQRRAREFLQGAFFLVAAGAFAGMLGLFFSAVNLVAPESSSYGLYRFTGNALFVLGVIAGLAGLALAARAATWRPDNDLAKLAGAALARDLGDEYTLVRNVNRPGLGYIDAVLAGPPGALVFRIMDKDGLFLNEGDRWLKADKSGEWATAGIDPTRQAAVDIKALREFLGKRGLGDVPVYGVVAFIHEPPRVELTLKDPQIPAATLNQLIARLGNSYFAKNRIPQDTVARLVRLLCPN